MRVSLSQQSQFKSSVSSASNMPNLRTREPPVFKKTADPFTIDNGTLLAKSNTTMHCQSGNPNFTTPSSVRRSERISNMLTDTQLVPGDCAEAGPSSTIKIDNVDSRIPNDNVEGQETPDNKDNLTNSKRGRGNASSRSQVRGRGKLKLSSASIDIQDDQTTEASKRSKGESSKWQRKVVCGKSGEVNSSNHTQLVPGDCAEAGPSSTIKIDNVDPRIPIDNVEGQETPDNKDSFTGSKRGRGNVSSRSRVRGRGRLKLSSTSIDIQDDQTTETSKKSIVESGKWQRKVVRGKSGEVNSSKDESEKETDSSDNESDKQNMINSKDIADKNVEMRNHVNGYHSDKDFSSNVQCHVGDDTLCLTELADPARKHGQENTREKQGPNNGPPEQDAMEVDSAIGNEYQDHNDTDAEFSVAENAASLNQNQSHTDRHVGQENAIHQNQVQDQSNRVTARDRFLAIARQRASHFAFFNPEDAQSSASQKRPKSTSEGTSDEDKRDWPGPFSTARRLVEERAAVLAARKEKLVGSGASASLIEWSPTRDNAFKNDALRPPLEELCLGVLCKHVEFIESLEGIPDSTKNKICRAFCASRKVTAQVLRLFITGSQTEICVPDCSLISEIELNELIAKCSTTNLEVLQLGLCGRGLTDRLIKATFALPSVGLPCLTRLSLNGAYRLSDIGLKALVQAAPLLSSVDLSRCSFLSEASINALADHLAPAIRELRLEECNQLDAIKILPELKKMHKLEVLSVAGITSVTDEFVTEILAYLGCDLRELYLADCGKLTDSALQAIGAVCCGLNTLTLDNLYLLTDASLAYLTNGCRSLKKLSLKRCSFSDEAVAAFVAGSGNNLSDLSLNSVKEVDNNTILSLVSNASENLRRLDLSWCRKLTDEALGLLADSCLHLHELILFGCTQVTDKFLKGHSNSSLEVSGV